MTTLQHTIEQHLCTLTHRLNAACRPAAHLRPGDVRAHTDDFLVAAAQHLNAVAAVVLPQVHHLPEGRQAARSYVECSKRLEHDLVTLKAKQYGQAQNAGRSWAEVWASVRDHLADVAAVERALVRRLSATVSPDAAHALGEQLGDAVRHSPTRPHPHLPHRGVSGRMARSVWRRADRVWDELEGRVARPLVG